MKIAFKEFTIIIMLILIFKVASYGDDNNKNNYESLTEKIDFCKGWKFKKGDFQDAHKLDFDDTNWENVNIPHTWNADDMFPGKPQEEAYIGPAWYRKHFEIKKPAKDERVFLLFEAVGYHSKVYIDGKFIGGRNGGYLSFRLDITDALSEKDKHVVSVEVSNAYKPVYLPLSGGIGWERYGGIYREVWLLKKGGAFFDYTSIRIQTPVVNREKAKVEIGVRIWEKDQKSRQLIIQHRILSPDGKEISKVKIPVQTVFGRTVPNNMEFPEIVQPHLWSPNNPNLYKVESSLLDGDKILDREINPLGFRWFKFDPQRGFSINDQPMKLVGVNCHPEYPGLGNALPERVLKNDIRMMKEAGMNFMRASHYPRSRHILDACDELGIMVLAEQPFWHRSMRTHYGEELVEIIHRYSREMVEQQGNHPCIIAWNTVNEIMLGRKAEGWPFLKKEEWPFAKRCIAEMNDVYHRFDPSRPTSVVIGAAWQVNVEAGITELADIIAFNGGAIHSEVKGKRAYDILKEAVPSRICIMSEGILNKKTRRIKRCEWEKELTWRDLAHEWSLLYEREWFCGGAMWVFANYSSRGKIHLMGTVDFSRLPYESYYFFESLWSEKPMAHICGHWSWENAKNKEMPVILFTNCDKAELFLNGKSVGIKKQDSNQWPFLPHPPIEWKVPFEPGELKVIAYKGNEKVIDIRKTESDPHRIELQSAPKEIKANGKDVSFITVFIRDKNSNRCYNSFTDIEIDVSGAAKLAGPEVIQVRGGLARFAVRSTGEAGRIKVNVKTPKLPTSSIELKAEE